MPNRNGFFYVLDATLELRREYCLGLLSFTLFSIFSPYEDDFQFLDCVWSDFRAKSNKALLRDCNCEPPWEQTMDDCHDEGSVHICLRFYRVSSLNANEAH